MHSPIAKRPTEISSYVLVTASYNEESAITGVIRSVAAQTYKPTEWIIVDDGSTDHTQEVALSHVREWPFIRVVVRKKEAFVGHNWAARVDALNYGYSCLTTTDYDFIGILDADITFEANYYESVINRLVSRPELGVAGGNLHERHNGRFLPRPGNRSFHVPGAVQLFRRECYEQVGGLKPFRGGYDDTVAEITARMYGWTTESFNDLPVFHHRPTGLTATNPVRARYNEGATEYSVGYHPLFQLFSSLRRIRSQPFLIGAASRLAGYWVSALCRAPRHTSPDFVRYLQKEQMGRIRLFFQKLWDSTRWQHI